MSGPVPAGLAHSVPREDLEDLEILVSHMVDWAQMTARPGDLEAEFKNTKPTTTPIAMMEWMAAFEATWRILADSHWFGRRRTTPLDHYCHELDPWSPFRIEYGRVCTCRMYNTT